MTVTPESPAMDRPGTFRYKTSIVVGGLLSESTRRASAIGERPRVDVLELESRLGARVFDLAVLDSRTGWGLRSELTRQFASWTGRRTQALAQAVLGLIHDDDVVYATGEDVGYPLALMMRLFGVTKPALIVRLDQAMLGRTLLRRLAGHSYIDTALKRMDRIGCHSVVQVQYLNSAHRVPLEKLCLLPPKVDSAFFSAAIEDKPEAGLLPERPYILSGGLEERDYGTLIEAASGLPVDVVIGAASPWSHYKFGHSETLPANVRVGAYSPLQMRRLYHGAELVVAPLHPTLRTCGVSVVLESWSMGKAVVATRTIGQLAYTRDGEDIVLVPPRDAHSLRNAITELLERPSEIARLGAAGRRRVEQEYNLQTYVDLSVDVFSAAAESRRGDS